MRQVTMAELHLARRLLMFEADQCPDPKDTAGAEERACRKLRFHLVRLIGREGYFALLTRALALAKAKTPWLSGVTITPDGSLEGLRNAALDQDAESTAEGYVAFLAHIIRLLVIFIGKTLTIRILSEAWPETIVDGAALGSKGETEQ